nr:uncharacterized protein LOC127339032 [Lolium perenne]
MRATEAKKATELKKAAKSRKMAADPASMTSSREEPAAASKAAGATASSAGPIAGSSPSASASSGEVAKAGVESTAARGPDVAPPVAEEEMAGAESAAARSPDDAPPGAGKVQGAVEGSGLSAKMKEHRTKAARDHAHPISPEAPAEETPSTEVMVQGGGTHESRRPPLSSLSFTELHTVLGEVHVAEVKRLTALVEEAAKKNRQLIAIGTEAQERALAEAREGFVKESFYREAEFRATQAEEAKKKAKAEIADLTNKGKLEAAAEDRDTARGAAAALREEIAALKQQHAKELAAEKAASEGVVLAVQAEKTSFEAFVREMSRQLLARGSASRSPLRVRCGGNLERGESASRCKLVETATPRECLEAATTRIIACAGEILAALQYLSPREVIPRDAPSVFKAFSDIPAVVDWLRRSSCRVGVTMALSMVLAHYSEGFDVEEVTASFPWRPASSMSPR